MSFLENLKKKQAEARAAANGDAPEAEEKAQKEAKEEAPKAEAPKEEKKAPKNSLLARLKKGAAEKKEEKAEDPAPAKAIEVKGKPVEEAETEAEPEPEKKPVKKAKEVVSLQERMNKVVTDIKSGVDPEEAAAPEKKQVEEKAAAEEPAPKKEAVPEKEAEPEEKKPEKKPVKKTKKTIKKAKATEEAAEKPAVGEGSEIQAHQFVQNYDILGQKFNYDEMAGQVLDYFEDDKWKETEDHLRDEMDKIRIEPDMNPGTLKYALAALCNLNDELSVIYDEQKKLLDALCDKDFGVAVAYQTVHGTGSNVDERKRNGFIALSHAKVGDHEVNYIAMIAAMKIRFAFLNNLSKRIQYKSNLCITMSGAIKMEQGLLTNAGIA